MTPGSHKRKHGNRSPTVREGPRQKSEVRSPTRRVVISSMLALALAGVACFTLVTGKPTVIATENHRYLNLGANPLFFGELTQGSDLDYSNFKHNSARHASLACNACHQRTDNSITPKFPSHPACTGCHLAQFVTPAVPMCSICHVDVKSAPPPLKAFPAKFNESFNVKFDHAQHLTGAARPQNSCNGCHAGGLRRGVAFTIPSGIAAHRQCYACHTPGSQASGRDLASCGVCHEQRGYARTTTNAAAFRLGFSHADHGPRQRLGCAECHKVTARAPQSRQVSSPRPVEHFPSGSTMSCVTCHNGRRSFGGDLAFADCKRCHEGGTFR